MDGWMSCIRKPWFGPEPEPEPEPEPGLELARARHLLTGEERMEMDVMHSQVLVRL